MTPSGIEPATFQFVAQHLNHCATAVPLLQQQICNLNLPMSLVPNTTGPRVCFMLITSNLSDFNVTCCFHLHSSLLFPASVMTVLFMQLSHTLWCPYSQGRPNLATCSMLMTATCAPAHFSPHIDVGKMSLHRLHWSVLAHVSIYCQLHIVGHRCNCNVSCLLVLCK